MTTKNKNSEKNTISKIEDVLKPLFVANAPKRDLVNTVWDFEGLGELEISEVEEVLTKAKTDLGFVYNPITVLVDVEKLIEANSIPIKNFTGIHKFISTYAEQQFTTFKVMDKVFKNLLGDAYPKEGKKMLSGTKQEQGFKILFENLELSEHQLLELMLGNGDYPRVVVTTKENIQKPVSDDQIKKTKDAIVDYVNIVKLFNSKLTIEQINNLF